jgi:dTDP-4-amino-4,6-dideoxygalactose transaminase
MTGELCACPGLGYSPEAMVLGWLRSFGKKPDWLQDTHRRVLLTHQGRTAIGVLCSLLGLGSDDEVLLPAYNCGAEVDPFVRAKCKVLFYRIDRAAKADLADIRSRLSSATRLVYVTHFFGWPQEIAGLADLCRQRGVLLVEDCAQALFSEADGREIGNIGDASIYSFVKSLAVPDGGALAINPSLTRREFEGMRSPEASYTVRASLPLFKKWVTQTHRSWQKHQWSRRLVNRSWTGSSGKRELVGRPPMLSSNCFIESRRSWQMSRVAIGCLARTNAAEVIDRRRRNFACLQEQFRAGEHLRPLYRSLPDGVCPLAFPVFAQQPAQARAHFEKMDILVQGWPGYYPNMPWDDFPEACALKDTLITLPVHQDLSLAQMEYIAKCASGLGQHSVPAVADDYGKTAQTDHVMI